MIYLSILTFGHNIAIKSYQTKSSKWVKINRGAEEEAKMTVERTLVLIKPPHSTKFDSIIKILNRYVASGLRVIEIQEVYLKAELFYELYGEHREKKFFHLLQGAYCFEKVIAICLEGENAIDTVRAINGATDPLKAANDTLRRQFGDLEPRTDGFTTPYNAVHGSEDLGAAERELRLFFPEL